MKKIIWGTLAGGIFAFFFGWLFFGIILAGPMESFQGEGVASIYLPEDQLNWLSLIVSNLLWGLLTTFVMVKWAKTEGWMGGMKVAAVLFFLIAATWDTSFYSMTTLFTLSGLILDVVATTVYAAIVGAVVGFVVSKVK